MDKRQTKRARIKALEAALQAMFRQAQARTPPYLLTTLDDLDPPVVPAKALTSVDS